MLRRLMIQRRSVLVLLCVLVGMTMYHASERTPPLLSAQDDWLPGYYHLSLEHDGLTRTFWLFIPGGYDAATPAPLVVGLHGGVGSGAQFQRTAEMNNAADARGFIAVYPDGTGILFTWNAGHCCGNGVTTQVDDVGFIRALIAWLDARLTIDPDRMYATGMSNGGMMAYRLAAEASDLFAAVGPVAGSIGGQFNPRWDAVVNLPQDQFPVSMIVIHGMQDEAVRYEGGTTGGLLGNRRVDWSVAESVSVWVTHNVCISPPVRTVSHEDNIIIDSYTCDNGAAVELITIMDGTHSWPGSTRPTPLSPQANQDIDATALILDFFLAHPRP